MGILDVLFWHVALVVHFGTPLIEDESKQWLERKRNCNQNQNSN